MGRSSQWYSICSKILDDDAPKPWCISDLEPETGTAELAEKLAAHFTNITNESEKLTSDQIPISKVPNVLIP